MTLNARELSGLYDRHAREILAFLARRTSDPEAAVDILAETFAEAFEDRHRFDRRDDGSARAWLYAIARHRLADYFRSERARGRAIARLGVQRRDLTDSEYERIEELAGTEQLRGLVADHIDRLPDDQQQAVRLRLIDEEPYERVAAMLGISQATARARVSRALRALRAALTAADSNPEPERTAHHA
jgi:RNA polymerase sigma-70 factor (ECF subfamily)